MNLATEYLGFELKNPLVPSASPLSKELDVCRQLEDSGAAAIVLNSIFEEEISTEERELENLWNYQDIGHHESSDFIPSHHDYKTKMEEYLEHIAALKLNLDIPVIASLNGVSNGGWVNHAKEIEEAGADALELNVYLIAADSKSDAGEIESRYLDILTSLKQTVKLPIILKLSNQFSSLANFIKKLEKAGAGGVAVFNRFYQPDIDLTAMNMTHVLPLSTRTEALERMRWIGILHGQTGLSLAATGGVHETEDVIKLLMCGADVTHMCSALLRRGPKHLKIVLSQLEHWLNENEYESVSQLKGSMSLDKSADPDAYQRANYLEVLQTFAGFNFADLA